MAQKTKLIRNLKPGDVIQVTDATRYPSKVYRVTVTRVQESTRYSFSGKRTWDAFFTPHLMHGSWCSVWGYSDDRMDVYETTEIPAGERVIY
jgi:hypothetical protein